MERREIEQNIIKKLHEIWDLYKQYDPDGIYLSLFVSKGESETIFCVNNDYWLEDTKCTINVMERDKEYTVNHAESEKEN